MESKIDFIKENTNRALIKMFAPLFMAMMLTMLYNMVDSFWVGNMLGEHGMSALTAATAIVLILNSLSMGMGNGLSHVDLFEQWVLDYLNGNDEDDTLDADCRMTVMLLAGDAITCNKVEETYDGTYLMFDIEAIEHQEAYSILKEKKQLFTTLFGEMPITKGHFKEAFGDNLKKHGIHFKDKNYTVISILFKAFEEDQAFVGHTGILMDCRDRKDVKSHYLFVEKLAFHDAYRVTGVQDTNELLDILLHRPDYTVEEGEMAPIVYQNEEMIGELK